MEIPLLGMILIPATVLLIFLPIRWMIPLFVFTAPFKASSVINFGAGGEDSGLQAGFFSSLALIGKFVFDIMVSGRVPMNRRALYLFAPLFAFLGYALITAALYPRLFSGVLIYPAAHGPDAIYIEQLKPTAQNVTQSLFLFTNVVATFLFCLLVTRPGGLRMTANAYIATSAFIIFMGVYQLVSFYTGLYYPYDVINNNPGYRQNFGQAFEGIKRFSSVFTEPSAAAQWLVGFAAFAFVAHAMRLYGTGLMLLGFGACFCVLIGTSTTGYASAAIMAALGAAYALGALIRSGGVHRSALTVATVGGVGLVALAVVVVASGLLPVVLIVIDVAFFNKLGSTSGQGRLGADGHALWVFAQTWGLGAGWGGNTASSLATRIISTVGLPGVMLLALFVWRLITAYRRLRTAGRPADPDDPAALARPLAYAVTGVVLAGVIAAGDPSSRPLWVAIAMFAGAVAPGAPQFILRRRPAEAPGPGPAAAT